MYQNCLVAEDEREFDYIEGSEKGPRHWGELKKEWEACNNGDLQSPIDLSSQRVKIIPKLGELKRSYNPCNATVKNRGHDISVRNSTDSFSVHQWLYYLICLSLFLCLMWLWMQVYWVGKPGSIQVNGVVYDLQQSHWHSPSEHSINGRRYLFCIKNITKPSYFDPEISRMY